MTIEQIRTLNIQPTDIIIISRPKGWDYFNAYDEDLEEFIGVLNDEHIEYRTIIEIEEGTDLSTLDEEDMNNIGWFRRSSDE